MAELSITADERYLQSLTYGLIISTGILSMIVCGLRVRSWLEGFEIWWNTGHELILPTALHKSVHHQGVWVGRYRCLCRIGMSHPLPLGASTTRQD